MLRNTLIRLSFGGLLALGAVDIADAQSASNGPPAGFGLAAGQGPGTSFDTPDPGARTCAPAMLFRARVRNISPGVSAADRAAQPREIWRQGSKYMRTDEMPDPVKGDEASIIIAEPDVWSFDRASKQGRHDVDPGPVLEVRAPILPPTVNMPPALQSLEYGCEGDFIMAFAPRPLRPVNWGATQAMLHSLTMGEHTVAIIWDPKRSEPLMLSYLRGGQPVMVVRYDEYQQGMPERPALFAPPKTIAFDRSTRVSGRAPMSPMRMPQANGRMADPNKPMMRRPVRPKN